jgi:multisubunit Na+/H+ antiporter MnhB subunit
VAEQPWWIETLIEPIGILVPPVFLFVAGSAPDGMGGVLGLAGFVALALGSSLSAVARRTRAARGPESRAYWRSGSAAVLLIGAGLAGLLASVAFFLLPA